MLGGGGGGCLGAHHLNHVMALQVVALQDVSAHDIQPPKSPEHEAFMEPFETLLQALLISSS